MMAVEFSMDDVVRFKAWYVNKEGNVVEHTSTHLTAMAKWIQEVDESFNGYTIYLQIISA